MEKIKVTKLQRENALYARDVMWPGIAPEQVIDGLSRWACGTQACFGGWCAVDTHFQKQGVYPYPGTGAPTIPRGSAFDTAMALFGDVGIFDPAGCYPSGSYPTNCDDHTLVTNRLNWLIENSEVID